MLKLSPFLLTLIVFSCSQKNSLNQFIHDAIENGQHEIVIEPGTYSLDETIELTGVHNLLIRAGGGGDSVVLMTSSKIFDPKSVESLDSTSHLYELKDSRLKGLNFPDRFRGYAGWPELYVNGVSFQLARYPNEGYLQADSIINPGSAPRSGDTARVKPVFISHELSSMLPSGDPLISKILLNGYWRYKWYDETIRVESIQPGEDAIKLAAPHYYGLGGPAGALFYALNHPFFLDQPLEYYFDSENGSMRFILPDFLIRDSKPEVRVAIDSFPLFRLVNCSHVVIEGLQLAYHAGTAVEIENCDSVTIVDCQIQGISNTAVKIEGGTHCGVSSSTLTDLGASGILLSGGRKADLSPAEHFVKDCSISHFAKYQKTYAPAVNIQGVGQTVSHNVIRRSPHNAILFSGNDHLIENNHISEVCLNTSDAGAIYCGRDWTMGGTVIRRNSIQSLGQATHHHNWAIYLDDLASGITVEDNFIADCPSGILVGGGRYNRIIGNQIRNCPKASIMYDARGLNWYIPYLEDSEHTLWTRLREVPVDQSPWKDRFPWLQHIAEDDPGIPKHVEILGNEISNSAAPAIHPTVKKYGHVQKFN